MQWHNLRYPRDSLLTIDFSDDLSYFDRYFLFDLQNMFYVSYAAFQIEIFREGNI